MSRLWRPVLPAALAFSVPFFFMLPLAARGFELIADCLSPGEPAGVMAYLVGRKPA
ncbi:MAG: hypothetical protein ACYC2I_12270 [Elusimicrobiales bacterium]